MSRSRRVLWVFVAVVGISFYGYKRILANIEAKPAIVHHEKIRLRNDAYSRHVAASEELTGNKVYASLEEVKRAVGKNELDEVQEKRGFKIEKLTHSVYYLNPDAYQVLKDIGHEFNRRTNGEHFFTVTSLLRTVNQQKGLTKTNSNASPNTSTHSFGTSFDISYWRFDGLKQQNEKLQKVLEGVLADFQEEKKVFVVKERKSTCFHVTVRPE